MSELLELDVTALAAGGDGVARDATGRVTFIPRACPGDRVRVRIVHATSSFARAELVEIVTPSPDRVEPPCPHFARGCGGCQWQHVARPAQLAAKHAIVAGALRKLTGLVVHPVDDPTPPYHWRRRARLHVVGGKVGLYALDSRRLVDLDRCPQLDARLDAPLALIAARTPPDGELALVVGHDGAVAVGTGRPWKLAARLLGQAEIRGVVAGGTAAGEPVIEVEPGLWGGPWDFAQASEAGNARLVEVVRAALGAAPGRASPRVLELFAGAGNFTRGLVEDGWRVLATDAVAPARTSGGGEGAVERLAGPVAEVLGTLTGTFDAIVLDPPRAGAAAAIDDIVRLAPRTIVYVSCDPATLARDAGRLVEAGYRATDAWPIDLMPQTAHVEVVMRLVAAPAA